MALMPNPLVRRLASQLHAPGQLAGALAQHMHGPPGADAAAAASAAGPSVGHESLPVSLLAAALGNQGQFHFGAPTPPPGVTAAPEGSYNPAEFYRETGNPQYAAQLWESHHPYAMAHGQEPGWVERQMTRNVPGGPGPTQGVPHGFGPGGAVTGPVGSRGTPYTEPIRNRRHVGLAQALQALHGAGGGGGAAVHPYQAG